MYVLYNNNFTFTLSDLANLFRALNYDQPFEQMFQMCVLNINCPSMVTLCQMMKWLIPLLHTTSVMCRV